MHSKQEGAEGRAHTAHLDAEVLSLSQHRPLHGVNAQRLAPQPCLRVYVCVCVHA